MAMLFSTLLGLSALILGYLLYTFNQDNFIRETEAAIDSEIENILAQQPQPDAAFLAKRGALRKGYYYLLRDSGGQRMGGNVLSLPQKIDRLAEGTVRFVLTPEQVEQEVLPQAINVAGKIHTFTNDGTLLVARDIAFFVAQYDRLQQLSWLIIGLMLTVVIVSFYISIFVVGRINEIGMTARQIMETGDLSRRIAIVSRWDDLSNLAQILNALLARLEELMGSVRDVADNIAHDLRTPLTRIRNQLELLGQNQPTREQTAALTQDMDQILAAFNALLRIATIERGNHQQPQEDADLAALLGDVLELYEPVMEEKNITVTRQIETPMICRMDKDLVFQALVNILDNAAKFTPAGGNINVCLSPTELGIFDNGPGIPEMEREKVFRRFYRSDSSRHTPGSGLGLSLVAAVMERHGWNIVLGDNRPGLRVVIRL